MFISRFHTAFVPSFSYLKNTVWCAFSPVLFMALRPEETHETCSCVWYSHTAILEGTECSKRNEDTRWERKLPVERWESRGRSDEVLNQNVPRENCWFVHAYVRYTSAPQKWLLQCRWQLSLKGWGWAFCFCLVPLSKHFPYQWVLKNSILY